MINWVLEANKNFGTSFTKKEMLAHCYQHQERLKKQWIDSNRTDYSVYEDEGYAWDCILSYYCVSQRCLTNGERFFRYFDIPKGKALDVYNGNGLSTLHANLVGFDCEAVATNGPQIEFAQKSAQRHLKRNLVIHSNLSKIPDASYDVVMSFEVLEHFLNPVEHAAELLRVLKPGGYIIESTGFKEHFHTGHFEFHEIDGKSVHHRKAATLTRQRLEQEATKVMVGYDKKPRIWVKALIEKPENMFRGISIEMDEVGLPYHFQS